MEGLPQLVVVVGLAIPVGLVLGCGVVYAINWMPASWLTDYDQEPSEKVLSPGRQRVKGMPWKYVISATFIVMAIYMATKSLTLVIPGLILIWILVVIGIVDFKYMIIPDQMTLLLAITAIGLAPYHSSLKEIFWGAIVGGAAVWIVGFLGKVLTKRETMGFGDVKLCAALGMCFGVKAIVAVMVAASFMAGCYGAIGLMTKRIKRDDAMALGPFLALAAVIYMIFFFPTGR